MLDPWSMFALWCYFERDATQKVFTCEALMQLVVGQEDSLKLPFGPSK